MLGDLLHGEEARLRGDSASAGQGDVLARRALQACDFTHANGYHNTPLSGAEKRKNRTKSKVHAKVEHVFKVLKCQFGFDKVRYCGLGKNTNHIFAALALVNIAMSKRRLLRMA